MIRHRHSRLLAAAATLALVSVCALAQAAHPAVSGSAKAVEAAKPAGEPVAYDALEHHVGDEILVETTFNTLRRGTLIKYTNPTLTLQLGPEHGSIELSVGRDTVRSVRVLTPAAPAQATGAGSAEKN